MSENDCQKCDTTCKTYQKDAKTREICANSHQPTTHQTCQPICDQVIISGQVCEDGASKPCSAETQIAASQCAGKVNCLTCNSDNSECQTA